jgi:hypothetical protein
MVVVGAISYSALRAHVKKTFNDDTLKLKPLPACLLKRAYGLQISARRKNEIRDDRFLGLLMGTKKISTEIIQHSLQTNFEEKFEPIVNDPKKKEKTMTYKGLKSGLSAKAEIVHTLTMDEGGMMVWATQQPEEPPEFWLTSDTMDVSTFIKAFFVEKRDLVNVGCMVTYKADVRFEPFVRGCIEHGHDVNVTFTRLLAV